MKRKEDSKEKRKRRKRPKSTNRQYTESDSSTMMERGSATGDSNPPCYPPPYDDQSRFATSQFPVNRRSNSPETIRSYAPHHPAPCPSPVSDKDQ